MSDVNKTLVSYGAKDQDPIAMVFRKTIDTTVTPLTAGIDYALMKLPKGFSPCRAFIDVQTGQATTIDVDIMTSAGVSKALLKDDQNLTTAGFFTYGDDEIAAYTVADDDSYLCIDAAANLTAAVFEVVVVGWCLKTPAEMSLTLTDEDAQ